MEHIQIVENESLIPFCNFNKKIFLLNRVTQEELDTRVINISELTESTLPSSVKFPQLMTEIYRLYPEFDYEVLTRNPDNFSLKVYVCDFDKIKPVN